MSTPRRWVAALALAAVTAASQTTEICGAAHDEGPVGAATNAWSSIVGGEPSGQALPWMVSLQGSEEHYCGGTLIDASWILTAAHCVPGSAVPWRIVLGAYELDDTSSAQVRSRAEANTQFTAILHPDYDGGRQGDIALIHVSPSFDVDASDLVVLNAAAEASASATIAGWGYTSFGGGDIQNTLRAVDIDLVSLKSCREVYGETTIYESNLCAGGGSTDTCAGDSGGPLFHAYTDFGHAVQLGVVSWGYGCGFAGFYGVYSSVRAFKHFILEHVPSAQFFEPPSDGGIDGTAEDGEEDILAVEDLYKAQDATCSGLSRNRCKSAAFRSRCFYTAKRCRAHPLEGMQHVDYCAVMSMKDTWCKLERFESSCVWENGACVPLFTMSPTPSPTQGPTVRKCKTYKKNQEACEADRSCQWNGDNPGNATIKLLAALGALARTRPEEALIS